MILKETEENFIQTGPYVHEYLKELVRDTGIEDYVTVGEDAI